MTLNSNTLMRAAKLQAEIEVKQNELQKLLAGENTQKKGKRVLSPDAIEKIRAGQRKRWRNVNKTKISEAEPRVSVESPATPQGLVAA